MKIPKTTSGLSLKRSRSPKTVQSMALLVTTPIPYPRCFLCFSKESKTNFPKQFIIYLSVVSKRYFILFVSLQDWKSSVPILSIFCKKFYQFFVRNCESLHLMGILKGNEAHPPLYFCMYQMFFFPQEVVHIFWCHHYRFCYTFQSLF